MKLAILTVLIGALAVIALETPMPVEKPVLGEHWGSKDRILPMSFKHRDHVEEACVACHHNYVDDTGETECLICHVGDPRVADLLREQFHGLCMGCHAEKQLAGIEPHGPVRRCIDCHVYDRIP